MNDMVLFVALVGLTLLITRSMFFAMLQQALPGFFKCAQCVGFWIGVVAGVFSLVTLISTGAMALIWNALLVGAVTSVLALVTDALVTKLTAGATSMMKPSHLPLPAPSSPPSAS